MEKLVVYVHLAVIFAVGELCCGAENKPVKYFGAINALWTTIYAYLYAMWSLWQMAGK